jgi:hypothetical protein
MEFRSFDRNYPALAELIRTAWPVEHKSYVNFTEEYLQYLIESPAVDRDLTLAAYHKNKMICFTLSIAKEVATKNSIYTGLLTTLATTDPAYAYLFPYLKLKSVWAQKATNKGYDFNFGYMAWGIKNNQIEQYANQRMGCQFSHLRQFSSFAGRVDELSLSTGAGRMPMDGVQMRSFQKQDAMQCLRMIEEMTENCALRQRWQKDDFTQRMSHNRYGGGQVIWKNGRMEGFVSSRMVHMVNHNLMEPTCFIYNLFLERLAEPERRHVFGRVIKRLKDQNIGSVIIPDTGYFSSDFLLESGLRRLRLKESRSNLYIAMFKKRITFAPQESFYLEII